MNVTTIYRLTPETDTFHAVEVDADTLPRCVTTFERVGQALTWASDRGYDFDSNGWGYWSHSPADRWIWELGARDGFHTWVPRAWVGVNATRATRELYAARVARENNHALSELGAP